MVIRNSTILVIFLCILQIPRQFILAQGPHIAEQNGVRYLSVNNRPYIVMSVQDHKTINPDATTNEYYFKTARDLYANTISVTLRWYAFEKKQDKYDTNVLRNIKNMAEKYGLKVIILWFGTNICGHENCVPDYIRKDPVKYVPYTRQDKSRVTKVDSFGDAGIYCYSFDNKNPNHVLEREQKALQNLVAWIKTNDPEQTFIMLQLGNELFVNPDLWRPWPPIPLPAVSLLPGESSYTWTDNFQVHSCSLLVEVNIKKASNAHLEFALVDAGGKTFWNRRLSSGGKQILRLGGPFINRKCQLKVRKVRTTTGATEIGNIVVRPIAARCYCNRCNKIFKTGKFSTDQQFEQFVFMHYTKELAAAVALNNPDLPLYLNLYVGDGAKDLLGNPYFNPRKYMDSIADIDIIAPDIYLESSVALIDSFIFGRNVIFVPETGELKNQPGFPSPDPYSLIFPVLGKYKGIGVQVYDMRSLDFGLVNSDDQWENTAHLLRNSFSTISQILPTLLTGSHITSMTGFRQETHQEYELDGLDIVIKTTGLPKYARGIIFQTDAGFVIAGIGCEVEIRRENINRRLERIERGYWMNDSFVSTGNLKQNTHWMLEDKLVIRLDDDDFVSSKIFRSKEKQYVIRVKLQ